MEGVKSIAPLDCFLRTAGLPFKMTLGMMLRVAYWAQNQCSYHAAEKIIADTCGVFVNDETVRLVTNYIGELVFKEDCRRAEEAYSKLMSGQTKFSHSQKGVLCIETDGAALNTRHKDESGSTWRENKLGLVFSSDNIHSWLNKKGHRQHRVLRREYASYVGSVCEFKKHLLSCAIRNGYGKFQETVLLSDGATWIRNMAEELFPDAQQILDFFHLSENVHEYARYLFKFEEEKSRTWAEGVCELLKQSKYNLVLKDIEKFKDKLPSGCPVNLYGYIKNNINNIDYATFEEKGYFIGSGAIESGNKIVLQRRLKQAGMRWNTKTAQYLLSLKSKDESNLWQTDVVNLITKHLS
jgi:hypothetical protein